MAYAGSRGLGPLHDEVRRQSYEEIAADHVYAQKPVYEQPGPGTKWSHFFRAVLLVSPFSCFNHDDHFEFCCGPGGGDDEGRCFDAAYPRDVCCEKELIGAAPPGNDSRMAAPLRRGWMRLQNVAAGCKALRMHEQSGPLGWFKALMALPSQEQAGCIAGSRLAARLLSARPRGPIASLPSSVAASDAEKVLRLLEARLLQPGGAGCPLRRANVALRRNLLLWRHFAIRSLGAASWPLGESLARVLWALEVCRRQLPEHLVVHLHVPKTGGSSLCYWARDHGHSVRTWRDELMCHSPGDGPMWLGEHAVPLTCQQRVKKAADANLTWMRVERWVELPLCEDLRYAVLLRDPVSRVLSQFRHLLGYYIADGGAKEFMNGAGLDSGFFRRLWWTADVLRYLDFRNTSRIARRRRLRLRRRQPSRGGLRTDWLDLWLGLASDYQVRALSSSGGRAAFFEDGIDAAARLDVALTCLEQLDVVLTVGGGKKWIKGDKLRLLDRLLAVGARSVGRREAAVDPQAGPSKSGGVNAGEFPVVDHGEFQDHRGERLWYPYYWEAGERAETAIRNGADSRLFAHARLLQHLDTEYFKIVGST